MTPVDISLYAILDPEHCHGRPLHELASAAIAGGASLLQYRDKRSGVREMIANAKAIREALEGCHVPLIINDRVDVALAANADGVHLGQEDMSPQDARRLLGSKAIIGWSIKTLEEADAAKNQPLDYAFVGGVFETGSKQNPTAIGIGGWQERATILRRENANLPIGAIAGITEHNLQDLMKAGCDGIAAISAIFMADDVEAATQALATAIKSAKE